ncbi:hypothetical protein [uncultured Rhodoblastus sp.]|uniref:hypothetical protein n=1 Tax=uncultured Rhodoblastus sp. TaxID=543037 RepID=UPI0025D0E820|nr:hypothetical protein [uncultured Rhodoblastus sp.]
MLAFLSLGMSLMGLTFGPMSALLPELFPTNTRNRTDESPPSVPATIVESAMASFPLAWHFVSPLPAGAVSMPCFVWPR